MDRRFRGIVAAGATALSCAAGLLAPACTGATPVRGDLIVADARAYGPGALFTVDPTTGAESLLSSNEMAVNASNQLYDLPFTLATNEAGEIFVANTGNLGGSCKGGCGGVIKVNPETGAETVLSSNAMAVNASSQYFQELTGIAIDPQGNILVTSWGGKLGDASIIKVDPANGKETLLSSNQMPVNSSSELFAYPQGVIANGAGEIFVADPLAFGSHGGGIIGVNPVTGKESEVSTNSMAVNTSSQYFHDPSQMTFNASGSLLVADWCAAGGPCGSIIEVDPKTGKETEIASNSLAVNATSEYFSEPTADVLAEDGEIIEVQQSGLGGSCEHGCGGLVSIDPATGKETELSANSLPVNKSSEDFVEPFDLAVYGYTPSLNLGQPIGGHEKQGSSSSPGSSTLSSPGTGLLISGLAQSRRRWSEPRRHRGSSRRRRSATGTVFSFKLNQAARVELEFTRAAPGRRVHGACRPAVHANRRRAACTLTRTAGTLLLAGRAGTNTVSFAGQLPGRGRLAPGSYRVLVRALGGTTPAGAPRPLGFVILP